jgi:hypothetical protein
LLPLANVKQGFLGKNIQLQREGVSDYQTLFAGQLWQFSRAEHALSQCYGAVLLKTFLCYYFLKLIADLLTALQANRGLAAKVSDEDMAAEFGAEGALILEVLEQEHHVSTVKALTILNLIALKLGADSQKFSKSAAVPVQMKVLALGGELLLQIFISLKKPEDMLFLMRLLVRRTFNLLSTSNLKVSRWLINNIIVYSSICLAAILAIRVLSPTENAPQKRETFSTSAFLLNSQSFMRLSLMLLGAELRMLRCHGCLMRVMIWFHKHSEQGTKTFADTLALLLLFCTLYSVMIEIIWRGKMLRHFV